MNWFWEMNGDGMNKKAKADVSAFAFQCIWLLITEPELI